MISCRICGVSVTHAGLCPHCQTLQPLAEVRTSMTPPPAEKETEPFNAPFAVLAVSAIDRSVLSYRVIDADRNTLADRLSKEQAQWLCTRLNAAAPAPSGAQSEREAFEAWAVGKGFRIDKDDLLPDIYINGATRAAWSAWQARASAGSAKLPTEIPVCHRCGKTHMGECTHSAPPALTEEERTALVGIDNAVRNQRSPSLKGTRVLVDALFRLTS